MLCPLSITTGRRHVSGVCRMFVMAMCRMQSRLGLKADSPIRSWRKRVL